MDPQILRRVVEEGTQAQAERAARLTATNRALERVGLTGLSSAAPPSASAAPTPHVDAADALGLELLRGGFGTVCGVALDKRAYGAALRWARLLQLSQKATPTRLSFATHASHIY